MADGAQITIPKGEGLRGLISDFARPFALYSSAISGAATPLIVVIRMDPHHVDLLGAAALCTAVYGGLGAMYAFRANENAKIVQANADVAKAQAAAPTGS